MERADHEHTSTSGEPGGRGPRRRTLTVDDLAGHLEHRLHWPEVDDVALADGCAFAAGAGLPAVLCRPAHVPAAAAHLAGTEVQVVTALGFHDAASGRRDPDVLAEEAAGLVEAGATEVALLSAAAPDGDLLLGQLARVAEAVGTRGRGVRVLLDTADTPDDRLRELCAAVAEAGARLVQGGTFRGDRTRLTQVEVMRRALPRDVLLKWTRPVRSVETMLLCMSMGVDRFNGDPPELLAYAAGRARIAPLMLPVPGLDY